MFQLNVFLSFLSIKVLTIPLYYQYMTEPYYIKGVQEQPFADVL